MNFIETIRLPRRVTVQNNKSNLKAIGLYTALVLGICILPGMASAQDGYTAIPDSNFEQVLIDKGIDSDGQLDGRILTTDMAAATTIAADEAGISDLTGIESARSLKSLLLFGNNISTLDLSNNPVLETLEVSQNFLQGNLDLSNKADLISVDLTSNPNLRCVQVDNSADANAKLGVYAGWSVDLWTAYSDDCNAMFPGN